MLARAPQRAGDPPSTGATGYPDAEARSLRARAAADPRPQDPSAHLRADGYRVAGREGGDPSSYEAVLGRVREEREQLGQLIPHPF
jgi:hypothetical protein